MKRLPETWLAVMKWAMFTAMGEHKELIVFLSAAIVAAMLVTLMAAWCLITGG